MNCRLCDSPNIRGKRDFRSPYVDFEYTLYQCGDCSSAFFDLQQHQVSLEQVYAAEAETKAGIYEGEFHPSRYWRHEVQLIRQTSRIPIRSVLDVGCRTGDFLMHWPKDVQRVGVELSSRSAEVAKSRGLKIHQDYLENVRFADPFDIVTCYAVVEHLPDPISFLSRLSALVRSGGALAILVPTRECLKRRLVDALGRRWHMYSPPQHLSFISRALLDKTLSQAGFDLHKRRFTSGGMFNPLVGIPVLEKLGGRLMEITDRHSPFNFVPMFDHMYSYFRAR
jgi:SAM-dependent methyltransferase